MTNSLNVTPKTILIVRSGKSEASETIAKDCVRGITLLKLTTDRHKASRIARSLRNSRATCPKLLQSFFTARNAYRI